MNETLVRLSNDQQNTLKYISPSHLHIPKYHKDLKKMNIPFCLAVTPFPRAASNDPPPILPYTFNSVSSCTSCTAFTNNRFQTNNKTRGWICPICTARNEREKRFELAENSMQTKTGVFDVYFPENNNGNDGNNNDKDKKKNQKSGQEILIPKNEPEMYLLAIEHTDATVNNGLFSATLKKVREIFEMKEKGVASIFVFNSKLVIPNVSMRNKTFSISMLSDLEGDDVVLPPAKTAFFDLRSEKKLFLQYIDYLLESLPIGPPTLKLFDVVKTLNSFCYMFKIPIMVVSSHINVGSYQEYRDYGLINIRKTTAFKFICVKPPQNFRPPDFGPISEFSLIVNAKATIFSQSQINFLPTDIINGLLEPVYSSVLVYTIIPHYLKIVDIKGSGLRNSDRAFLVPYLSQNDTIYIYLDYSDAGIQVMTPSIQVQVRYLDSVRNRYIRCISFNFYTSDNNAFVANSCNYDVFIASTMIKCVDKAREFGKPEAALEELAKIRKDYKENLFSKLYILSQQGLTVPKISCAFSVGKYFLTPENFPSIMTRHPTDISRFFVPIGYTLDIHSANAKGPMTLNNFKLYNGALYVKLNDGRALIVLHEGEDQNKWTSLVSAQRTESNVREAIETICEEKVIEIIVPAMAADHNLYRHVERCITTLVNE